MVEPETRGASAEARPLTSWGSLVCGAHDQVRFSRAIERRALWMAEDAARALPNLPLEDALLLVQLYSECGSPKYEKAALP
jgi:hypothetical protein